MASRRRSSRVAANQMNVQFSVGEIVLVEVSSFVVRRLNTNINGFADNDVTIVKVKIYKVLMSLL